MHQVENQQLAKKKKKVKIYVLLLIHTIQPQPHTVQVYIAWYTFVEIFHLELQFISFPTYCRVQYPNSENMVNNTIMESRWFLNRTAFVVVGVFKSPFPSAGRGGGR